MSSPSAHTGIEQAALALLEAVNASDLVRVMACWSPEGILMPPHQSPVVGEPAIRDYFAELFRKRRLRFTFPFSDITMDGDLAVQRLVYTASAQPLDGGMETSDTGKGVHVYRRTPTGMWLLTWTSGIAMSQAGEGRSSRFGTVTPNYRMKLASSAGGLLRG